MTESITAAFALPPLSLWLTIFPFGIVSGCVAAWVVCYCREKYRLKVGYTRKIFHFIIFTLAAVTALWQGFAAVKVFGVALGFVVGYALLRGKESTFYRTLARPNDAPHETFYILFPYLMTALGGMVSNILFGKFALIGYIATGWGDAVGEPVGTRWGQHRYRVPTLTGIVSYRSLEGSAAVFLASFLGCGCVLFFGYSLPFLSALWLALLLALVTALVEAITFHSMDNFTIQAASSGVCYFCFEVFFPLL